jgi:hypothetical protein
MTIDEACTAGDIETVRHLFRAYADSLPRQSTESDARRCASRTAPLDPRRRIWAVP